MERLGENLRGVNFFGTDGIRGKTDTADLSYLEALSLFRKSKRKKTCNKLPRVNRYQTYSYINE